MSRLHWSLAFNPLKGILILGSLESYETFAELHLKVKVLQNSYYVHLYLSSAAVFVLEPLAIMTLPCFPVWSHLYKFQFGEIRESMLAFISVFELS